MKISIFAVDFISIENWENEKFTHFYEKRKRKKYWHKFIEAKNFATRWEWIFLGDPFINFLHADYIKFRDVFLEEKDGWLCVPLLEYRRDAQYIEGFP